ncbi:MAG: TRAP transporter small permease subunit [Tropicimonas sp.]|uniref:TRAP transporter small permease subunit n=1 Tax=Tropicimonas sp. TaxID=2067044 RepID=UPI003A8350C7
MFTRIVQGISLIMARLGGGALLAAALLVAVEVVLRKTRIAVFSAGTELSSYALAVAAAWALAYVVFERAHVKVDVVTQRLPEGPRAFLNVLALISLALVGGILSLGAYGTFATSLALGSTSNTTLAVPLFIPQGLWLIGLIWFTFVALWRSWQAGAALIAHDFDTVTDIAVPASAETEAMSAADEARHWLGEAKR